MDEIPRQGVRQLPRHITRELSGFEVEAVYTFSIITRLDRVVQPFLRSKNLDYLIKSDNDGVVLDPSNLTANPERSPIPTMTDFTLDDFLPYQLASVAERISAGFSLTYRARFGLSIPEWRIMAHLSQTDALSVRDLHQRAGLEKSKASRAAARLEASGLVEKRGGAQDKRLIELTLTAKGRAVIAEMIPLARAYEAEVKAKLTGTEQAALTSALGKLRQ
jgi:DNA-binding MarR family transcriptional regulator